MQEKITMEQYAHLEGKNQVIFRPLIAQQPHIEHKRLRAKKNNILHKFNELDPEDQSLIVKTLSTFAYDPGTIEDFIMNEKVFNRLREVDKTFNEMTKPGVKILNKKMMLVEAEEEILSRRKITIMKFDVSMLRLIDKAGHGDHLLISLSTILNSIAEHNPTIKITAARTGGDSFCLLVSSASDIDPKHMEKIYKEVDTQFAQENTYYMIDQDEDDVRMAYARLKKEKGQILLANRENDSNKMLRVLVWGRIPDYSDLYGLGSQNVNRDELRRLHKRIRQRHLINNGTENLSDAVENLKISHPELKEQIDSIRHILSDKNKNLSEYILSFIKAYHIDPLFDEEVMQTPDFYQLLHAREKIGKEKIIHIYNPWLKNMNTRSGESATDKNIIRIYRYLRKHLENIPDQKKLPRARKDGSDFIFISSDFRNEVLEIEVDDIPKDIFKNGKLPVFVDSMNYPSNRTDINQDMKNMKTISQTHFINWLNSQFVERPKRAEKILDYYLEDRTEDRCRELLAIINTMPGNLSVSDKFKTLLESKLKKVIGSNKAKALEELEF